MDFEDIKPIEKVSHKIVKNTIYNALGNFTLLTAGLILIPYIIKHIGVSTYGNVWVIAVVLISFSQLFDFGIGSACTKYISEYHTKSDLTNLNKIVSTSFFFFLTIWIILYLLILIFNEQIIKLIGTAPEFRNDMKFVLPFIIGIVAINHITSPFYATINAIQRYDILNITFIISSLINVALIILFFNFGLGVKGVAVSYFIFYLIVALSSTYFSFKKIKGLNLNPSYVEIMILKKIFLFGGNLQISRLAQILTFQIDKFLTLRFFGGSPAAFYEIGSKISGFTRGIPLLLVSAIVPVASEYDAKGESEKLIKLFETGTRYLAIFGLIIGGFVFTHANLIVQSWVGKKLTMEGITVASSIMRFLIVGYFVNMLTGAMSSVAMGFERTDFERRAGILMMIVFPMLIFILVPFFDYYGIAIAASLTIIVSSVYYMLQFVKAINFKLISIINILSKPLMIAVLCSVSTLLLSNLIPEPFLDTRIGGIITVIILFIIYCILFLIFIILFKMYQSTDVEIITMLKSKFASKDINNCEDEIKK